MVFILVIWFHILNIGMYETKVETKEFNSNEMKKVVSGTANQKLQK